MGLLELLGFGSAVSTLSPADAHMGQNAGDIIIIDVREPSEWAQTGFPKGSHTISMNDPKFVAIAKELAAQHPHATVVVSCKTGARASAAAKILAKNEIENLAILRGGMLQWTAENLPVDTV